MLGLVPAPGILRLLHDLGTPGIGQVRHIGVQPVLNFGPYSAQPPTLACNRFKDRVLRFG